MNFNAYHFTPQELQDRINKITASALTAEEHKNALKLILACIDLTTLEGSDTVKKVEDLCHKALSFEQKDKEIPKVAAVCVYPNFIRTVKEKLAGSGIKTACVAGAFPSGQTSLHIKVAEVSWAAAEGADEIDMVISRGKLLEGKYDMVAQEIAEIKKACGKAKMKVILETGELASVENIRRACELALLNGADFLKTSTGKIQPAATELASIIMLDTLREYYEKTGIRIGFKPAGGITEPFQALNYYKLVDAILGKDWLNPSLFRVGASRLADRIYQEILNLP